MKKQITKAGGMYGRLDSGQLVEVGDVPLAPDVVICRRLRDYAPAPVPYWLASVTACSKCGFAIAFNPAGPFQDRPKVCMQCAGIKPLPIEASS